ncbi:DNA phosphorothioation-dependent restriction protein DptF [Salinibius halmophilus]|uniref:DNA phosphorothioation-dependent restriction protein DptF n=1 Tax=Salinibius halmophilus TaxID=1853216 RepID=UPI000E668048|nr:DNA phosphorothioation-dependent restriction protein DptF [Salinibius halmophilus]
MRLREVLSVLSKSSALAVTTQNAVADEEFLQIKRYLHVKTEIEEAFESTLKELRADQVLFLCGSSGDGKSEILTRYSKKYGERIDFHLDATHSFDPDETAIEALNRLFDENARSQKPLVVGINIGMLANFAREGSEHLNSVKSAINTFLTGKPQPTDKIQFLDFEAFPKFRFDREEVSAPFFSKLINQVVVEDKGNRFNDYLIGEIQLANQGDRLLVSNFLLLRDATVQKCIVELLLNARIKRDQFITARMLLDFIYCLLTGPNPLFDNLFLGGENELLQSIAEFDPSVIRTQELDQFILHRQLEIENHAFSEYVEECAEKYSLVLPSKLSPASLCRLMFITYRAELNSQYPKQFEPAFSQSRVSLYRTIWNAHWAYDGEAEKKASLRRFYSDLVFKAVTNFANRNAEYLGKDVFFTSQHGDITLAAEAELSVDYKKIAADATAKNPSVHSFNLHLKVNDTPLLPIPMNANLLDLMLRVVDGFRPNKYEQNSVVLLDELVNEIVEKVSNGDTLKFFKSGEEIAKLKNVDEGEEFRVGGYRA